MKQITFEQLPNAVTLLSQKLDNIERLLLQKNDPAPAEHPDKLLSVSQAADFLNLSVPTIYSKVSRGELPCMKRGKRLYFSQTELMDYLKAGKKLTNAEIDEMAEQYMKENKRGAK